MPSWHHIDEVVFGPAIAPAVGTTGYNELVLTPHVPSDERVGVLLIIEDLTSGQNYYAARASDDPDDYLDPSNGPHGLGTGLSLGTGLPDPAAAAIIAFTGPTGIVDWVAQNAQSTRVTLAGWFSVDYDGVLLFDPLPIIPPNVWKEIPHLAEAVEYIGKLAFLKIKRSVGSSGAVGMRHRELLGDPTPWWEPGATYAGGSTIAQNNSAYLAAQTAIRTGSTGLADWMATAPSPLVSAWLSHSMREPWIPLGTQIYPPSGDIPAPPPTTWTKLDLYQYFGRRHVLVAIEIYHATGPNDVPNGYSFRRYGDTRDYLGALGPLSPGGASRVGISRVLLGQSSEPRRRLVWVESGDQGEIEWIADSSGFGVFLYLYGYIEGAVGTRFSLLGSPYEPDYTVVFDLESSTQVIQSSINFWMTDPDGETEYHVIIDGSFNSPWGGTIVPNDENGFTITVSTIGTPIGLYVVGDWTAVVEADNIGSGSIRTEWIIPIDTASPALTVYDGRYDEEVITTPYTELRFRITDQWGFDLDTLRLEFVPSVVEQDIYPETGTKQLVIDEGEIQAPYTGLIQENSLGGAEVTIRNIPRLYSLCRWRYLFDGQSIVEKELDVESMQ